MPGHGKNYYGLFFQDGNPLGMNESVLQYPGQLGVVASIYCQDSIERELQIVQVDSTMSQGVEEGATAFWKDEAKYLVTTDDAAVGYGLGRCVGVFTTTVANGNYTAIVRRGRQTPVWFVDAPTAAPSTAGLFVIPTTTDGKADSLAAASAATYPPIGRTSGAQDGTTKRALCDVDVYGTY